MVEVTIGFKKHRKLELRSIAELEELRGWAIAQVKEYKHANPVIPAKRLNTYKQYLQRYEQQVTILDELIAIKTGEEISRK